MNLQIVHEWLDTVNLEVPGPVLTNPKRGYENMKRFAVLESIIQQFDSNTINEDEEDIPGRKLGHAQHVQSIEWLAVLGIGSSKIFLAGLASSSQLPLYASSYNPDRWNSTPIRAPFI